MTVKAAPCFMCLCTISSSCSVVMPEDDIATRARTLSQGNILGRAVFLSMLTAPPRVPLGFLLLKRSQAPPGIVARLRSSLLWTLERGEGSS